MNNELNCMPQLHKVSDEVRQIMDDFNSKHSPTPSSIRRHEQRREYYHNHKYDHYTMSRHLQLKQERHDIAETWVPFNADDYEADETLPKYLQLKLMLGKFGESKVKMYLTSLGYLVTDINSNLMSDGYYSPFDMIAVKDNTQLIIDAKYQSGIPYFCITDITIRCKLEYQTNMTKCFIFLYHRKFRYITLDEVLRVGFRIPDADGMLYIKVGDTKDTNKIL